MSSSTGLGSSSSPFGFLCLPFGILKYGSQKATGRGLRCPTAPHLSPALSRVDWALRTLLHSCFICLSCLRCIGGGDAFWTHCDSGGSRPLRGPVMASRVPSSTDSCPRLSCSLDLEPTQLQWPWAGCLTLWGLQGIRCAHKQVGLPCCSELQALLLSMPLLQQEDLCM